MEEEKPAKKKGLSRLPEARLLAAASSIGLSMVFAIVFGAAGGHYLDKWLGTKPWLFFAGLLVGLVAAFNNLVILSGRIEKQRKKVYGREEDGRKGKDGKDGND
ncbi:MAG: AtpZ/AtpI family protein [Deltaproteobacteria bacterium]|jgi:ATP synthase protein I|nr:AtpZ/AtpI family protein [Deltaproteobacteria bacterium]